MLVGQALPLARAGEAPALQLLRGLANASPDQNPL